MRDTISPAIGIPVRRLHMTQSRLGVAFPGVCRTTARSAVLHCGPDPLTSGLRGAGLLRPRVLVGLVGIGECAAAPDV